MARQYALRHRGKNPIKRALTFGVLSVGASLFPYMQAYALDNNALPSGGNVVGGNASFDYSTVSQLHVTQSSDRAVINWDSFNIGQDALTQFHQLSSSSVVVNRVTGSGDPTQILGSLSANGIVMVLDRNGVVFGQNSRVDVGGIVVSTGDLDTTRFMAGDNVISLSNMGDAAIINEGTITVAEAGIAAFVAPSVINNGLIEARLGSVSLASGVAATLDLYGDGLVEIAVDQELQNAVLKNSGTINAQGGRVAITAAVAKDVVDNVINMSGIINASSAVQEGGKIILGGGNIEVSGTLDASGKTGGGEIFIGGDYQGRGDMLRAENAYITGTALIKANTTGADGDGGKVIVWSDGTTQFDGVIEAKGGNVSGDGGLVETSGKRNLGLSGLVDASAENGLMGEWLLDPSNVTINAGGTNISSSGGVFDPGSDNYTISASSIQTALNNGNNVTITTTSGGAQAGNIAFDWAGVTIDKTNGGDATLTLKANGNIEFNNAVIQSSNNKLNVVGWADYDASGNDGNIVAYGTIKTNGGNVYLVGGLDNGANGGAAGDGIGDNYASNGITISADIDAQGGNIVANGSSTTAMGVMVSNGSLKTSGAGNITVRGSSSGNGWVSGVLVQTSGEITADTGTIDITGTNTGQAGGGIWIQTGGEISTSGTTGGNINLTGSKTNASFLYARGVTIHDDTSVVKTVNGNITVSGTGANSGAVDAAGVVLSDGGDIYSTGSGSITLTGTAANSNGIGVVDIYTLGSGTSYIGDTTGTGNITFNTNILTLDNAGTNIRTATAGKAIVKPRTTSQTIGLGGGTGNLNLTDAELGYFNVGTLVIGDSALGTGDMIVDSWNLSGKAHHVELYGNDITIQDTDATVGQNAINLGTGNFMAHAMDNAAIDPGSISVTGLISKNQATDSLLNLRADHSVSITAGGATNMITTTGAGKLNVILNSDRDADHLGSISISNSNITTNGGYFTLGGGINPSTDYAYGFGGSFYGINLTNANINLAGGNFSAHGHGDDSIVGFDKVGVYTNFTRINTGAGNILINGYGGIATSQSRGVSLGSGGSAALITTSGSIDITGISQGTAGTLNYGVSGSVPITTTSGIVNITGTGAFGSNGINLSSTTNTMTMGSGNVTLTSLAGDIYLNMGINKTAGASANLLLRSHGNILLDQYGDINSTSNALNVVLNADRDADNNGAISISSSTITTNGGYFVAGGGVNPLLTNAKASQDGVLDYGVYLLSSQIDTGAGNITLRGAGDNTATNNYGVYLNATTIETTDGEIDIHGHGGNGSNFNHGIYFQTSTAETSSGDITLTGSGQNATGGQNIGVTLITSILNSDTGNVTVNGTGGTSGVNSSGINTNSSTRIETNSGDISLTGYGYGSSGGLILGNGGTKILSDDGSIYLKGTSANGGNGIHLNGARVESVGSSDITLEAISSTGNDLRFAAAAHVKAGSGQIEIVADDWDVSTSTPVGQLLETVSGNILIAPRNTASAITIGADSAGLSLNDLTLSRIRAGGTLVIGDSTSGTGDIDIDSWDLSAKTHHVQLFGNDIDMGGITTGAGNVYLYAKNGDITISADSNSNAAGHLNLLAGEDVFINEDIINAGTGRVNIFAGWDSSSGITTNALFDLDDIELGITDRDITFGTNGRVSSAGTGTSVLLVATGDFKNNSGYGVSAISAAGGRYLVYSENPTDTVKGGLTATDIYSSNYESDLPSSITGTESRFIFEYQPSPVPTVTASNTVNVTSTIHYETTLDSVVKQKVQEIVSDDDRAPDVESKSANCLLKDNTGVCLIN